MLFRNVFTQIPHPLHLYHNYFHYHPALPLAFTQPHSAACQVSSLPQKVIHCLHWWPVISLSSFSALPRRLQNVANRQLTPHFCYSIWTEHFHNESYQITWLHYTFNYSVSVQLSPRHFHLWGRWNINPCTWSQTVQLSSAYSLHVYWFAVRSKPEQPLHTALHKS